MSNEFPLPANPNPGGSTSPHGDRPGFSRSGFAPIPHRHSDMAPLPPPPRDRDERDRIREFPRRDLDPDPEMERRDRRGEWDDFERRRNGSSWEPEYDRPPKRRRSPSPNFASHRPRQRSPSPPFRHPAPGHNMPDPAEVENLLTYGHFAAWFRASHPQTAKADDEEVKRLREAAEGGQSDVTKEKVGMGKRYERYRKEYTSRQLYALYLTHRAAAWFIERYSPESEFVSQRRRVNRQGRVPTAERYLDALRTGEYDSVSFDAPDEKSKADGNDNDEPEGLYKALEDVTHSEDSMRVEVAPGPRQIFVKTVPPNTSRKDLEAVFAKVEGFQYLAITEPAIKKAFHRVAWVQFAEGVDVEEVIKQVDGAKIDSFTFHMGVNATPSVGRTRMAAPLANSLDRLLLDSEKAHRLAEKLEEDLMGDDEEPVTGEGDGAEVPSKPREIKLAGLRERGTTVVQNRIDQLLEDQGLIGDELDQAQKLRKAKLVADHWISYLRNGLSTCYYCVAPTSFPEEMYRKCISHLRPHPKVDIPAPPPDADDLYADLGARAAIDGEDEDRRDVEENGRSEPAERKGRSGNIKQSQDEKWEENVDTKLRPLLEVVDVTEYGGRDPEEETRKACAPHIKQEETSKYRCKDCNKLFRAAEFVIKHVAVKHPELIDVKNDDISTLNNFVLDPQHIQPMSSTPAAVNDRIISAVPSIQSQPPYINPGFPSNGNPNMGGPGAGGNINLMQHQMMMQMMHQVMMTNMNGGGGGFGGAGGPGGPGGPGPQRNGMGGAGGPLAQRMGGYVEPAPLPPPPPGGEDPRARRGRVSYQDLDEPGGGADGGLPY